jgi:lipopolysaccharide transport system ATP-binding protein
VISAEALWKRFKIPHERRTTVVEHAAGALSILGGSRYSYEEFWALKDVSFHLEHGESLGVIGPNGSGKSTLLKIVAGVMRPDKGIVRKSGVLAPVLELGIGFHGDLSVKENALIYGVLMGLSRSEVKKRTGSILEFAGLTKFQDAKLKHLSSGMQVRLGFAIAIQSDAEIFLVDESLAVGDIEFQKRCLEKFREFKKQEKSIVLVSHNLELVGEFCEKAVYLLNGESRHFGTSQMSIRRYTEDMTKIRTH